MKDSKILVKGQFSLTVLDAVTGNIIEEYVDANKIVTLGHQNVARLLGGNASGLPITRIGFGTNGSTPGLGDTTLTNSYAKNVSSVEYPTVNSVRFVWSLDANEGNGITIRELGLLTSSGVLCARKVRSDIVKTDSVRLTGSWTITIN